ncbi:MAG: ABC transporter transmembrane domain-containing protein [Actinomycetia bacterium]|nr:ABC transporter transmembrane domain-containing protein [Actinomycetes bacterium]
MPNETKVRAQRFRSFNGPGGGHLIGSGEKATDFMATLKRLLGMLRDSRIALILVVVFSIASVSCSIASPKVMMNATNKLQEYVQMKTAYPQVSKIKKQFTDADKQLEDKQKQLVAASKQLTTGRQQLAAAQEQIAALPAAQQQAAKAELDAKAATLEKTKAQLMAGQQQLDTARATMADAKQQLTVIKLAETDSAKIAAVKKLAASIPAAGASGSGSDQIKKIKNASDSQLLIFAKLLVSDSTPKLDLTYIGRIALWMVALFLLYSILAGVQQRLGVTITQELVRRLRRDVSEKLDRLPLKFFDSQTHGEILSKITIDIDLMSTNLQQVMTQTLSSVFMIIGIIIMMFTLSWALALISCVIIPLTILVTGLIAPRAQRYFARQQAQLGEINGQIEENYGGHNIIKTFNREEISLERFKDTNNKLFTSAWRAQFMASVLMPVIVFATNLQYVLIVVVAAIFTRPSIRFLGVNVGGMTVGAIFAFIQYLQQFQQPMQQMAQIANVIQGSMAAAERVFVLLDEEEEAADPLKAQVVASPQGAVAVKGINFDYDPAVPLIRDWNMMTEPGKMVAIVGPTGAGKTTIVNLLMRFYEINSGKITIDGVDTSTMKRADVRKMFGMVLQDTWLYSGTIRENIAYGKDDATEEEIVQAADTALADHFIRTLPQGYDTEIQEDANNLSAGQRQLLTIARAVLADAPVLILDEATSSVDTRTEQLIQAAMARLMHGRTSFVIAHRLSTIRNADQILVMKHGRIVESGNHDELLAADGFYAQLYNSQFAEDEDA